MNPLNEDRIYLVTYTTAMKVDGNFIPHSKRVQQTRIVIAKSEDQAKKKLIRSYYTIDQKLTYDIKDIVCYAAL